MRLFTKQVSNYLVCVLALVLVACAWTPIKKSSIGDNLVYVRVVASGNTDTEARQQAFRMAVSQVVGDLISSERIVRNDRLVKDQIIDYSTGYVEKFNVVSRKVTNNPYGIELTMDVWVKSSQIANKMTVQQGAAGVIQGSNISAQIKTLQQEQAEGAKLLDRSLNDFYTRGFEISLDSIKIEMGRNGNSIVTVPFKVKWNKEYLQELLGIVTKIAHDGPRAGACLAVFIGGECPTFDSFIIILVGGFMGGDGGRYGFRGQDAFLKISSALADTQPNFLFALLDSRDRVVGAQCLDYDLSKFISSSSNSSYNYMGVNAIFLGGNASFFADPKFSVTVDVLEKGSRFQIYLTPKDKCINFGINHIR